MKQQYIQGDITKEEYINYLVDLCKAKGANLLLLEQMLMFEQTKRLDVMERLFRDMTKNCIVFAHHTEYLNFLKEHFEKKFPDKNIYIITGTTSIKKRDKIIKDLPDNNNCILFASYGCTATGLTLKNIDYGVFAESFKSQIINKQAMGRGLCLANDKKVYKLYDIIDCFPTKKLLFQGKTKESLYKKESFDYKVVNL
jgi:superfamily II DNA or RNA helicase